MRAIALAVGLLLTLGGCAHVRPEASGCVILAHPIRPEIEPVAPLQPAGAKYYDEVVQDALKAQASRNFFIKQRASMLLLSGGGPEGAFGAGLLYGLPPVEYGVVTGVSSGAQQATLAFLATQPVNERDDLKDLGDGVYPMHITNLGDLAAAFSIGKESTLINVRRPEWIAALATGSIGSLEPLKQRLLVLASDSTLRAVKKEAIAKRVLMVGVTDLDDGLGYALDLTDLAKKIREDESNIEAIRGCFVDALLASSSNPAAVKPAPLRVSVGDKEREHLFIDGGARFGVFLPPSRSGQRQEAADVTVIVNGPLYGDGWRGKDDGLVEKWKTLQLYMRSVEVLSNQVYRFSVDTAARYVRANGGEFRLAFLSNDGLPSYTIPGNPNPQLPEHPDNHIYRGLTCAQWRKDDDKSFKFRPKYMACLTHYGVERGKENPWNHEFHAKRPAAPAGALAAVR